MPTADNGERSEFPPVPPGLRTARSIPGVGWIVASRVLPCLLALGLVPLGFGLESSCTDSHATRCDSIDAAIVVGAALEVVLFTLALVASHRTLRTTWLTRGIVLVSLAIFVGVFAFSASR